MNERAGVRGEAGDLRVIMDDARELVLAVYASPCVGVLHSVVPLMNRLMPTPNDPLYGPNV